MKSHNSKKFAVFSASIATGLLLTTSVLAGTPDGMGPWADTVVASNQGLRKDGTPVLPERSDPTAALGVAEEDTQPEHFYSLGFGGSVTVAFQNGISSGVFVVEATNDGYPNEMAEVEISVDGLEYTPIGTVNQDGEVEVPEDFGCAQFVRITDMSNPEDFEDDDADGYDVDGVMAVGEACAKSTGKMTGGGTVSTESGSFHHGFQLSCDATVGGNFQMNWGKGHKFHMESVIASLCTDDPTIDPGKPKASFDTYIGVGTGKYNGVSGYTIYLTLTDAGEPGFKDTAKVEIRDSADQVVYNGSGLLNRGNHQAHK